LKSLSKEPKVIRRLSGCFSAIPRELHSSKNLPKQQHTTHDNDISTIYRKG
jgi:hypothetical protein